MVTSQKISFVSFTPFLTDVSSIELPQHFTYPFYYSPHRLSLVACRELQDYLKIQTAHTSKGLESGKVKIWSDFRKPKAKIQIIVNFLK